MRRIGVLMTRNAEDPEEQARLTAFLQGLQEWGWSDGHNVRIDVRWSGADPDRRRRYAAEMVALAPDVIFVPGSAAVAPLRQTTRTVPIADYRCPWDRRGARCANGRAIEIARVRNGARSKTARSKKWFSNNQL
jgi:hypothetical protein